MKNLIIIILILIVVFAYAKPEDFKTNAEAVVSFFKETFSSVAGGHDEGNTTAVTEDADG